MSEKGEEMAIKINPYIEEATTRERSEFLLEKLIIKIIADLFFVNQLINISAQPNHP